ncbi:MAG: NifB/NifX family molybdenum-iron cluster-binding protein [Eubacteriales bacterium]|nr:NifB/NifX family molybdenum-iron cluster-binding protein [Eubacteriales bacterium]
MKIAATYENGAIAAAFAQTTQFKLYTLEHDRITQMEVVDFTSSGADDRITFLQKQGVGILVCDKISSDALLLLNTMGIAVFPGAYGEADLQVGALVAGLLTPVTEEKPQGCDCTSCDGNCSACHPHKTN